MLLFAGQSPWAWSWMAVCRLYVRSVCDTKAPLQLLSMRLLALHRPVCYMPLPFAFASVTVQPDGGKVTLGLGLRMAIC